jgi:UDP-glucose:(heptosyl)LPS alpha-1,3-glucosyltransferase
VKIALAIGKYDAAGGGAERWTDRHARYLIAAGHEVHLVAHAFDDPPVGASLHRIDEPPRRRLRFAAALEHRLRGQAFDAIHDMGDGWFADVLSPHHGTRLGGFLAGEALAPAPVRGFRRRLWNLLPRYREFARLEDRQMRGAGVKLVVALSEMIRRDMQRHYRVADHRLRVVYNGVDSERFHPPQSTADVAARERFRAELGWQDRCVYAIVAHNFRLKGVGPLMNALALVKETTPQVGLLIAGAGRESSYRRLALQLGIAGEVRFLGNRSDALAVYHAADVYVQPTFYDPCSLVVLEALACGLPTITSKRNGAGELIERGQNGWVVDDPADARELADAMRRFAAPSVRKIAGPSARRLAKRHSLRVNSERYLDLYRLTAGMRRAA